jgi:hypothetical protein
VLEARTKNKVKEIEKSRLDQYLTSDSSERSNKEHLNEDQNDKKILSHQTLS